MIGRQKSSAIVVSAVKIVLAVFCSLSALWMAAIVPSYVIQKVWRPGSGTTVPAEVSLSRRDRSIRAADPHTLWQTLPRYPSIAEYATRAYTVNGKSMQFGGVLTRAPAHNIIDYYLDQMVARGWTDVTEEFFNIQSYGLDGRRLELVFQDPRKVEKYEKIRHSNAVFRRGDQSLYITLTAAPKNCQRINVILADCPSLKNFWTHVIDSEERTTASGHLKPFLEISNHGTVSSQRTVKLFSGSSSPRKMVQSVVQNLTETGWEVEPMGGQDGSYAGNEYLLTKDNRLAFVTVSKNPRTGGSQAMMITVEGSSYQFEP